MTFILPSRSRFWTGSFKVSASVDKASALGFAFPCDGPGRGGTCQASARDLIFLATFWLLNTVAWLEFACHWKHLAVWTGKIGLFGQAGVGKTVVDVVDAMSTGMNARDPSGYHWTFCYRRAYSALKQQESNQT